MKQFYMIEFDLPTIPTPDFSHLIAEQEQQINELIKNGMIQSYAMSKNNERFWVIATANSDFEAMKLIEQLPLSPFFIPSMNTLKFHQSTESASQMAVTTS